MEDHGTRHRLHSVGKRALTKCECLSGYRTMHGLEDHRGKDLCADSRYRMDLDEADGLDISVIVDRAAQTTKV